MSNSSSHVVPVLSSSAPPIESELVRLVAHKNVLGALVITRASGIVIRSAGTLFATSSSSSSTAVAAGVASTTSDLAIRYAAMARNIVDNTSAQVGAIDSVDAVKFLRIRTKKHELMITPDESFILVVVQDPTI